jgi:hypothetical protein
MNQYSFEDLVGALTHALFGYIDFAGQVGLKSINVTMDTEKTVHDTAADGVVMVSKIAGSPGTISIEVQQTSELDKKLLAGYNLINNADASQWAQMAMSLRNVSTGNGHFANGVSFQKVPDRSYQAQGQYVTWVFKAADIQSITT